MGDVCCGVGFIFNGDGDGAATAIVAVTSKDCNVFLLSIIRPSGNRKSDDWWLLFVILVVALFVWTAVAAMGGVPPTTVSGGDVAVVDGRRFLY